MIRRFTVLPHFYQGQVPAVRRSDPESRPRTLSFGERSPRAASGGRASAGASTTAAHHRRHADLETLCCLASRHTSTTAVVTHSPRSRWPFGIPAPVRREGCDTRPRPSLSESRQFDDRDCSPHRSPNRRHSHGKKLLPDAEHQVDVIRLRTLKQFAHRVELFARLHISLRDLEPLLRRITFNSSKMRSDPRDPQRPPDFFFIPHRAAIHAVARTTYNESEKALMSLSLQTFLRGIEAD